MPDHVHMCIAIPPKHPVASVIGFLKGKSAIAVARLSGKERNFTGEHLWARGYAVSTVGFELEQVHRYIRDQEQADGAGQFCTCFTKARFSATAKPTGQLPLRQSHLIKPPPLRGVSDSPPSAISITSGLAVSFVLGGLVLPSACRWFSEVAGGWLERYGRRSKVILAGHEGHEARLQAERAAWIRANR